MHIPSPIPHPLAWWHDCPGWVKEALGWVVGVDWPEGNEKLVWDLADHWHQVGPALMSIRPAIETGGQAAAIGFGFPNTDLGAAIHERWGELAGEPDGDLPILAMIMDEVAAMVESTGNDIEAAKIEMYVELGIMVVELLGTAVAAVLTLGAASGAGGLVAFLTRMSIQRIFKRLLAQLLKKGVKAASKEAAERVAKRTAANRLKSFTRYTVRHAAEEGFEELAVNYGVQQHQVGAGHRDGLSGLEMLTSAGGGAAGGAFGGLAGLGKHASNRFAQMGEKIVRGSGAEFLGESGASLVMSGEMPSLDNIERSLTSGAFSGALDHGRDLANDKRGELMADRAARLDATARAADGVAGIAPPSTSDIPTGSLGAGLDTAGHTSEHGATFEPDGLGAFTTDPGGGPSSSASTAASALADGDPGASSTTSNPGTVYASSAAVDAHGQGFDIGRPVTDSAATTVDSGQTTWAPPSGSHHVDLAGTALASDTTSSGPATGPAGPAGPAGLSGPSGPVGPSAPGPAGPSVSSGPSGPSSGPLSGPASSPASTGPVLSGPTSSTPGSVQSGPSAPGPAIGTASPSVPTSYAGSPSSFAPPTPTHPSTPVAPSPRVPAAPSHVDPARVSPAGFVIGQPGPDMAIPAAPTSATRPLTPDEAEDLRHGRVREWANHEYDRRADLQRHIRTDLIPDAELRLRDANHKLQEAYDANDMASYDRIQEQDVDPVRRALADLDYQGDHAYDAPTGVIEVPVDLHPTLNTDYAPVVHDDARSTGRPDALADGRAYDERGGHRRPLEFDQDALAQSVPRDDVGRPQPRPSAYEDGSRRRPSRWFSLLNDGGPNADPTRGINCVDCVLSLFQTWFHGDPRVSAPRTFDAYRDGHIRQPVGGQQGGLQRAERLLGTPFTTLFSQDGDVTGNPDVAFADRMRALDDALHAGGPGSFAMITHETRDGGSHTWAAFNEDGTIVYADPQQQYLADRPLYGPQDPGGLIRLDVAIVDGFGRPIGIHPHGVQLNWTGFDPTGPSAQSDSNADTGDSDPADVPLPLVPGIVAIPESAMNHVLHGDINADGEFGGWHLHPGPDPSAYPPNRFINGVMRTNPDGSVTVRGTVGYMDDDWNPTPKDSIAHTFFPADWTEADVRAAGQDLFENGTYIHNGTEVNGYHRGVEMVGYLDNGVPTTFWPTGG